MFASIVGEQRRARCPLLYFLKPEPQRSRLYSESPDLTSLSMCCHLLKLNMQPDIRYDTFTQAELNALYKSAGHAFKKVHNTHSYFLSHVDVNALG